MEERTYKDWTISPVGDLTYEPRAYTITADRLDEDDWFLHMMEKGWCDMNEFVPAYFQAMQVAGIKTIRGSSSNGAFLHAKQLTP